MTNEYVVPSWQTNQFDSPEEDLRPRMPCRSDEEYWEEWEDWADITNLTEDEINDIQMGNL